MCACGEDEVGAGGRSVVGLQSFLLASTRADDRAGLRRLVYLAIPRRFSTGLHPDRLGAVLRREHGQGAHFRSLAFNAGLRRRDARVAYTFEMLMG